ncbi:MAG: Dcp1-like decapping family-domain-containing protein [Monoraphidium minutum]|nr:MAG: Dcp1-like decapping family-domain-containing protein [Monoraphidium minutum]
MRTPTRPAAAASMLQILASAGQVCLYKMSVDDQQWQRKNIEGSMFLIKRNSTPRFKMVVLNKLTTDNYMETVHGGLELELNPPYLMYTHGDDEIHGVWFYDQSDLDALGRVLRKIVDQLPKPDGAAGASGVGDDFSNGPAPPAASPAPHPMPAPAAAPPPAALALPPAALGGGGGGGRGDDAFWDRAVTVTKDEEAISGQRLVPNESLVVDGSGQPSQAESRPAGLHMLLKQAHQSYHDQRQGGSSGGAAPPPAPAPSPAPAPRAAPPSEPPAPPPQLLTPSFFQQQAAAPPLRPAPPPQPAAAAPPAPAAAPPPGGSSASLQHMLHTAARKAQGGVPAAAAAAAAAGQSFGLPGSMPLPPAPPPQPAALQQQPAAAAATAAAAAAGRERLRGALARLVANDAFVDMLAAELKAAGLMH